MKKKIFICVTTPISLSTWFKGQPKFLSKYYDIEIFTSFSQNIEFISQYEGVKINIVNFTRSISPLKDLGSLFSLTRYFIKSKPDVVYTLTPKAGLLGMLAAYFARVPVRFHVVVGLPLLEAKGFKKVILEITERLTFASSNRLFSNSVSLSKIISERLTKKVVRVIGNGSVNGVDMDFFSDQHALPKLLLRQKYSFEDNDFVFLFVGRVVKDKGIQELLDAFCLLEKSSKTIKLLILGDMESSLDPISAYHESIIKTNKSIVHISHQEDIRNFLALSDTLILPSYREGLPNILLEAGSFSLPLIASNINGCNEVIEDGINGILVEKKDVVSLYKAMEKILFDVNFYNKLKQNSRASIKERYEQSYFWDELHSNMEKFISGC